MENKNILISGAGIAGLTLAFWLKKYGFIPTIVEHAPSLREGGYVIDFFGAGYDVALKMGIIPDLERADLRINEIAFVDEDNRRKGGLNAEKIRKLMDYKAFNVLRSDLAKTIHKHLDTGIEYIFGNSIINIEQDEEKATVTMEDGTVRSFDLVIGADGLHSKVRQLLFGDEAQFEQYYGFYASSYTIDNYLDSKSKALSYSVPGKQASVYYLGDNKLATFFIFTSPRKFNYERHDVAAQKQILRDEFGNLPWECRELLKRMDNAPDFYFDPVSQIKMTRWSKGRVSLVGDACDCPSLLSGQGSTLAMVGAYILAGELKEAAGNYKKAFQQYENIFKPFIDSKQKLAQSFAGSFVPKTWLGLRVRNMFTNLMSLPFISEWLVKKFMTDKIELKGYGNA